jgi:spermidine synthase
MSGARLDTAIWISEYMTPWDVYLHGATRVLEQRITDHQELTIIESGAYGKALILDGKWQSSVEDEFLYHEALVHPAMLQVTAPRRVLVLGGGEGATIREVLRWKAVEQVLMVDIDGEVVAACRRHLPEMHQGSFEDPRLELRIGDAMEVLRDEEGEWDVVISDLSDPIEEGPSFELFTTEHFALVRERLASDGAFVLQAGATSPVEMDVHVRVINTLAQVFPQVRSYQSQVPTYASPIGFALASNRPIESRPDPDAVDRTLADHTTGGFRLIDGESLLGLLQTPAYVRRAMERESRIYTLAAPPRYFGSGRGKT